jgi:hypothetical protein
MMMRKLISVFLFAILLTTPALTHGATLEPDVSVGMMSSTNGIESSVTFLLGYDHIIDLPRIGNSQLLLSADVFFDVADGLNVLANGGAVDFNNVGAKLDFAWQSPFTSGLDDGMFSIGGSFQTTITATGERVFNLNVAPSMQWNMNLGGQDITIRSTLEMDFGMDRMSSPSGFENDLFYNQIYKR